MSRLSSGRHYQCLRHPVPVNRGPSALVPTLLASVCGKAKRLLSLVAKASAGLQEAQEEEAARRALARLHSIGSTA